MESYSIQKIAKRVRDYEQKKIFLIMGLFLTMDRLGNYDPDENYITTPRISFLKKRHDRSRAHIIHEFLGL